jgi:hypothetical protein
MNKRKFSAISTKKGAAASICEKVHLFVMQETEVGRTPQKKRKKV